MNVGHNIINSRDMDRGDIFHVINTMLESVEHEGISQFRVGNVVTTIVETAIAVLFTMPLTGDYEVFLQAKSAVGVSAYASNLTETGFTLNLSAGVNATFSYIAVGQV